MILICNFNRFTPKANYKNIVVNFHPYLFETVMNEISWCDHFSATSSTLLVHCTIS